MKYKLGSLILEITNTATKTNAVYSKVFRKKNNRLYVLFLKKEIMQNVVHPEKITPNKKAIREFIEILLINTNIENNIIKISSTKKKITIILTLNKEDKY